jgi:hypothetical protein
MTIQTHHLKLPMLSFLCALCGKKKRNEPKLSSVSGLSSLDSVLNLNKRTHFRNRTINYNFQHGNNL